MTLQTIKSLDGRDEYVLLPVAVYHALKAEIEDELAGLEAQAAQADDYAPFDPADYVRNPVALMRLRAGIKQKELARRLGVSQPYLSKMEAAEKVSSELLARVEAALRTGAP